MSSALQTGASMGRTMTGLRTPQVIGPGSAACTSTPTCRRTPAAPAKVRAAARPSGHGRLDRRSARICHMPASNGNSDNTVPTAQTVISTDAHDGQALARVAGETGASTSTGGVAAPLGTIASNSSGAMAVCTAAGTGTETTGETIDATGRTSSVAKAVANNI